MEINRMMMTMMRDTFTSYIHKGEVPLWVQAEKGPGSFLSTGASA